MLAALRRRDFALLWLGGLVSSIGDLVLYVALPFYVYAPSGSALATGGMFLAETLPRLLLGSLAGVFIDRWDRRRTMIAADVGRAALILLLLVLHSRDTLWLVYLVAAVQSGIGQFFAPARNALLPRLVPDEHLVAANSLTALSDAVTQLVGPSIGGALFALLGLRGVVLADSASFLFSALMLALLAVPAGMGPVVEATTAELARVGAIVQGWRDGLRLVRHDRTLATVFVALGLGALGQGIINVIIVIFVRQALHGSAETFGWIITAQGVGGLLGGLLVGEAGRRLSPAALLLIGELTAGGLVIVIATFPALLLTLVLVVPVGVTIVGYSVSAATLLQRGTTDAYRGRIFGALGTIDALMMLVGILGAGALGDHLGAPLLLAAAGVLHVAAGLTALALPLRVATGSRPAPGRNPHRRSKRSRLIGVPAPPGDTAAMAFARAGSPLRVQESTGEVRGTERQRLRPLWRSPSRACWRVSSPVVGPAYALGAAWRATRIKARSASFTDWESENTSATSGSKKTRFVPAAYCRAYLPRTASRNSYSGRMSRSGASCSCLIAYSLSPGSNAGADDPNAWATLGVDHDEYPPTN